MALFKVNWNLDGFRNKLHEAGEVIEADFDEVKEWVEEKLGGKAKPGNGVLTPVDATSEAETATDPAAVDLNKLTKPEIVAHAAEVHNLELDPALKKPELIAAVEAARAATTATSEAETATA